MRRLRRSCLSSWLGSSSKSSAACHSKPWLCLNLTGQIIASYHQPDGNHRQLKDWHTWYYGQNRNYHTTHHNGCRLCHKLFGHILVQTSLRHSTGNNHASGCRNQKRRNLSYQTVTHSSDGIGV